MKNLIKFGVGWLLIVITILLLFGCGPVYYLNHSKKDITKAIAKGAKISSDTTYVNHTYSIHGPSTKLDLQPYLLRKDGTRYVYKDTVIYKDRIKLQFKDNVVTVDCPDSTITEKIPIKVDNTIEAGYSKWYVIKTVAGFSIFFLVLGFLVGKIIKI